MKASAILAFARFALSAIEQLLEFIQDTKDLNAAEGAELKQELGRIQSRLDEANKKAESVGI
jgi:uncharacterized coiled-coil DUF342 family protein